MWPFKSKKKLSRYREDITKTYKNQATEYWLHQLIADKNEQEMLLEKNIFRYRQIYNGRIKGVDMNHDLTRSLIKLMAERRKKIARINRMIDSEWEKIRK